MEKKRRYRAKQLLSLEDRLALEARRLREFSRRIPPGLEREMLVRKAQQMDEAREMSEALRPSRSLQMSVSA
jgi:hypothetical protein